MIGVFDSGLGGLTVLRALRQRFPELDFRYLADHASTDPELVRNAVADKTLTYDVFAMVAGAAHRGARPDYPKLIARK